MKIAHVAKMIDVAGMEKHLLALLPGLRAHGVDSSLIVLVEPDKPMGDYVARMQQCGIPTEAVVIRHDFDPGLIGRLAHKFRAGHYDAVHTHLIHADVHGLIAARLSGVPRFFSTAHNDDKFRRRWPIRWFQRWLWRQVTAGIAISELLRRFLIDVELAPPERVHTVHYGLDPQSLTVDRDARLKLSHEIGFHPNAPVAGSICRLTEQKGLTYAIRAFWQIAEQAQGAQYIIIGDGPLRQSLQQEAEGFGLGKRIHFLGWRANAGSLIGAFDTLLMPSLWEGFGLVALEAMAARRPIIASRVSALPEIVDNGVTGFLAEPANPSALAECLLQIFHDPALARNLGENGRRRLETDFSVDRMIAGTLKVYQSEAT